MFCALVVITSVSFLLRWGKESVPRRFPLHGTVNWGGQPADNVVVSVVPDGQNKGPAANCQAHNGTYQFNTENGPGAGPHRVVITHYALQPDIEAYAKALRNAKTVHQQLSWEFTFDVPEQGPWKKDFTLE